MFMESCLQKIKLMDVAQHVNTQHPTAPLLHFSFLAEYLHDFMYGLSEEGGFFWWYTTLKKIEKNCSFGVVLNFK
jgi:hypothetical protein